MQLPVAEPKDISLLHQILKSHCCTLEYLANSLPLFLVIHDSQSGKRSRVCCLTVYENRCDTITDNTVVNIHKYIFFFPLK